jgi:hypothetical protein
MSGLESATRAKPDIDCAEQIDSLYGRRYEFGHALCWLIFNELLVLAILRRS